MLRKKEDTLPELYWQVSYFSYITYTKIANSTLS